MLRPRREAAGWSQQAVAREIGISRQAFIAIEAGRQIPSTALALALARVFECRVEDLFRLGESATIEARLAPGTVPGSRVAVGFVNGKCVAHPLQGGEAQMADGLNVTPVGGRSVKVLPLTPMPQIKKNILIAGCAPLIGSLALRTMSRYPDFRFTWLPSNNQAALGQLKDGLVHIAGVHGGPENQRNRKAGTVVNLLRWRMGLVVAAGNPLGIKTIGDLLRPKMRVAWREEGSGVHRLITQALPGKKHAFQKIAAFDHATVAQLVRFGAADVGITIESAALAPGLSFIPLIEERFDLLIPQSLAANDGVGRLIDTLASASFKREAAHFRYDMSASGEATTLRAA